MRNDATSSGSAGISIVVGDICTAQVEAIVNAANESLLPGGGVSGAIHRAAGPALLEECKALGWCDAGEVRVSRGYLLPVDWIFHTVGPVWEGGGYDEELILARCYRNCFAEARARDVRAIAFPAISTGVYEFPLERATRIALDEARQALAENPRLRIVFMCFDEATAEVYRRLSAEA